MLRKRGLELLVRLLNSSKRRRFYGERKESERICLENPQARVPKVDGGKMMDELKFKNKQLVCDPVNGDCFRACMTSILGIPNSPDLPDGGDGWIGKWYTFLYQRGLTIQYDETKIWREGFWIASVPSKNFEKCTHSIIMLGQEVYFDPSPKDTYKTGENLLGKNIVLGGWWLEINNIYKLESQLNNVKISRLKARLEKADGLLKDWLNSDWQMDTARRTRQFLSSSGEWMEKGGGNG